MVLDDYPDKDNTASGLLFRMKVALNDTGTGCPLYVNNKGKLMQCEAHKDSKFKMCNFLAVQPGEGMKLVLWSGSIRKDEWTWTQGDRIYVSTVEGALTNVKPSDDSLIQEVGVATYTNVIMFRPKYAFYEGSI